MSSGQPEDRYNDAFWQDYLSHPDSFMGIGRRIFSILPSEPRCQLCAAPFSGIGGQAMRIIGKRPATFNPNRCNSCEKMLLKHRGGAEIEVSMLFADIRGSTAMAERLTAAEYRALLDRFYAAASKAVFAHGGMLDKFVGDELVANFSPTLGKDHAARALATAQDLLRATGHVDPAGPWAPVGAGVHTGRVWFGVVGEGQHLEITTVGDPVNVTARLAAAAGPGEILISAEAAQAAGLDPSLERRSLELKGKELPTEVVSLRVS